MGGIKIVICKLGSDFFHNLQSKHFTCIAIFLVFKNDHDFPKGKIVKTKVIKPLWEPHNHRVSNAVVPKRCLKFHNLESKFTIKPTVI